MNTILYTILLCQAVAYGMIGLGVVAWVGLLALIGSMKELGGGK